MSGQIPRNVSLDGITVAVAACSISYELIFSQALTVIYGQTVTRYALTIGLYLFSLGLGAFLFARASPRKVDAIFLRVEVLLALLGPAGVLFIFGLGAAFGDTSGLPAKLVLIGSHAPIIAVGLLSGLELPLLTALAPRREHSFYKVLGWDYIGSLVGTVLYALWLYPRFGLIVGALAVGFANALAACAFTLASSPRKRVSVAAAIAFSVLYGLVLSQADRLSSYVSESYVSAQIEHRFGAAGAAVNAVRVTEHFQTRYQDVVRYAIEWKSGDIDECLDLDGQVQLCSRWVEAYHLGLVDVPMSHLSGSVRVLLLGGGDYIPVRYLTAYERVVSIEHVDLDEEFLAFAKRSPLLQRYNEGAYDDPRLKTVVADALTHVRHSTAEYDLIVVDLPGASNDKMLPLYSLEFYRGLRQLLSPNGILVTWTYHPRAAAAHAAINLQTLRAAGFDEVLVYDSVGRDDLGYFPQDRFIMTRKGSRTRPKRGSSDHVDRFFPFYDSFQWRPIERHEALRPNSIFRPNLDMLVGLRP